MLCIHRGMVNFVDSKAMNFLGREICLTAIEQTAEGACNLYVGFYTKQMMLVTTYCKHIAMYLILSFFLQLFTILNSIQENNILHY